VADVAFLSFFSRPALPKLEDSYEILESLGSGAYAEVFRCLHKKEKVSYAVKIVSKKKAGQSAINSALNEVEMLRSLTHPNLIAFKDQFDANASIQIVLELVEGGELFECIVELEHFTEDVTARLMENLLGVVKYMHSCGICHRDIKPENLLMKDKGARNIAKVKSAEATMQLLTNVKLVDFGFACKFDPGLRTLTQCCGTPNFIAPEILQHGYFKTTEEGYNEKCDVWSLGVLAYILLCGYPPFHGDSRAQLFRQVATGKIAFHADTIWPEISQGAKDFVSFLMTPDVNRRPSADQALQHSWLRGDRPETVLVTTKENLRQFNARSKTRGAVIGVMAIQRVLYLAKCQELRVKKPNSDLLQQLEAAPEKDLSVLDLSHNYLGAKGLEAALAAISNLDTVHTIDLSDNHLDNGAITVLVQTLSQHPSVTALDLSRNPITQLAARQLLVFVQNNRNVERIDLADTYVKPVLLAKIQKHLELNRASKDTKHRLAF